jgi:hypothetical protein
MNGGPRRATDRAVIKLGALLVIAFTALFAALHCWPPH